MDKCIVIVGNIADGVTFHGPFNYANDAVNWAEGCVKDKQWLVTVLKEVTEK